MGLATGRWSYRVWNRFVMNTPHRKTQKKKLKKEREDRIASTDFSKIVKEIEANAEKRKGSSEVLGIAAKAICAWFVLLLLAGFGVLGFNLSDELLTRIGYIGIAPVLVYLTCIFK